MKKNTQTKPEIFGTKEWAAHTVNCCTGCVHDCKYCYLNSAGEIIEHVDTGPKSVITDDVIFCADCDMYVGNVSEAEQKRQIK